jgi:hypothetical protein
MSSSWRSSDESGQDRDQAFPATGRAVGADRDHLHLKLIDNRGGPLVAHRIAFEQAEEAEALHPPSVEACW